MAVYWFNLVILFGSFLMSAILFLSLFASDSIAYDLGIANRLTLKAALIMLCIGQLHAMEGDKMNEVNLHDLLRDVGQFGFISFVHFYLIKRRKKRGV